jgi:hypothetical protein
MSLRDEVNQGRLRSDHLYYPRTGAEPWGLCGECGLAEAAHEGAVAPYDPVKSAEIRAMYLQSDYRKPVDRTNGGSNDVPDRTDRGDH